ncbi:MAG: hypothetical protein JWQ61_1146 [Collimonas fungivorans]|uniref:DUF7482 domain-containing protein n=1 Tax=Collimonas fungivorans TaxID=158899 RepID=UPI0026EC0F87|nr:hypothetical protein [Collimonas fungivorans]MDB5766332.1 hypothetical protein [Collimonas fungivorans]
MKKTFKLAAIPVAATIFLAGCGGDSSPSVPDTTADAKTLLSSAGAEIGLNGTEYRNKILAAKYPGNWNVFFPSTLAIDFKAQLVKLPLYKGSSSKGAEYYIITEASDFETAKQLGVNYAPKLVHALETDAVQQATFDKDGRLVFEGSVDFSPVRSLGVAGITSNSTALEQLASPVPGAFGDSKYSPLVKLPSGVVLNISYVSNATGDHDHIVDGAGGNIDKKNMTATLSFLDGYQDNKQYYYHLVTDANDPGPAAIEGGTYAPRLASIKTFGKDLPADNSPLLAFSPVGNGQAEGTPEQQGLNSLIYNYKLEVEAGKTPSYKPDPINVFPLQPANNVEGNSNNYSPLWDAHISKWNRPENAVRIKSVKQLKQLIESGQVTSLAAGSATGNLIPLVPNGLIINCPVIAQPDASVISAL